MVANLQVDEKDRVIEKQVDGKDGVVADLIDGKDRVYIDYKDATQQPVFALATNQPAVWDDSPDLVLMLMNAGMGGGREFGNMQTLAGTGNAGSGNSGTVSSPPIGTAVPEPSAWSLVGVAGSLGLAFRAWRRRAALAV